MLTEIKVDFQQKVREEVKRIQSENYIDNSQLAAVEERGGRSTEAGL